MFESATSVYLPDLEHAEASAVAVTVMWEADVLCATHLLRRGTFSIGEGDDKGVGCDFFLPKEILGVSQLTLLTVHDAAATITIPPHAEGFMQDPSGNRSLLNGNANGAQCANGPERSIQLPLILGGKVCVRLGAFTFHLVAVRAGKSLAKPLPFGEREAMTFFGMSLGAVASFMLAMAYFVPAQNGLDDQSFDEDQIYAMKAFLTASAEREREASDATPTANETARDTEGGTGTRALHEEGKMGSVTSRAVNKHYAVQGPRDNPDPQIARARLLWEAQHEGMIGLLTSGIAGDPHAPTAPWGSDRALGRDALSANGNMWGDELGEAFGGNGLGLSGIGEGGGGKGFGVGLGDFGGLGRGAGMGPGQGFGNGGSSLGHSNHKVRAPRVRADGNSVISGRLPPEVIQRIVRQNYGRFRSCYEVGLSRNPNLEGRVQVRFVIGRDGAVSNVQNGGSDLPDSGVVGCVIGAYYGLNFPQPEGGIVTVAYPIMFQPG
jgi:hypothetical protein